MNKKTAIVLIITVISPFILRPVLAQNSQNVSFPRLHPEAKALEYYHLGRQNNGYSWIQLAEISLWASGDSSAAGLARIRELAERLNNSNELPSSARERAEFILTYLHRNTLRTYSINQTRVDTIFANGNFNCVSSAVLYMLLCNSAGIDTSGVVTKDHSFVTVHINGENIDVETTNRFGFDPGNRREFHDQFGRLTGFSYVPARNYHDRQTISKIELISLILNNRISELEKQNRYSDAVQLAFDRAALLYGETLTINTGINSRGLLFEDPRIELLNRLFNYGTWLLRTNREEDSLRWAAEIASRFPDDRWQEFILAAVNNRITRFIREGKTNEARNFLEIYKTNILYANYSQLDSIITDAELLRSANQILTAADGDAVVNAIVNARSSGKITERRAA
ncbi:MAG: hypothetical protein LBI12_04510, partial [Treponema sp.]|nr:hypothetical protein [Treponema sp.]